VQRTASIRWAPESRRSLARALALLLAASTASPLLPTTASPAPLRAGDMPWRAAGLSERQAAAHLLARFTFGARPGDVDRVVARGLERWMEDQLAAAAAEGEVTRRLAPLRSLRMPAAQLAATYPSPGLLLVQATREGVLPARGRTEARRGGSRSDDPPARDSAAMAEAAEAEADGEAASDGLTANGGDAAMAPADARARPRRDPELRAELRRFVAENGYRRQGELVAELLTQKLVRAVYAENQLAEVMTDFWFNHFNVSTTDPQARAYVLAYERDAIRPYALGAFAPLLRATARHPAMLLYLDNARSVAAAGAPTTLSSRAASRWPDNGGFAGGGRWGSGRGRGFGRGAFGRGTSRDAMPAELAARRPTGRNQRGEPTASSDVVERLRAARSRGINENYARELLELHTLGVDGGYTQQDVVEVARAFTGWTVVPPRALLGRGTGGAGAPPLFRADAHDAGAKTVLGTRLPAGRGIEDGEQVLALLAAHPSTARHLSTKLARRFVADEPPGQLVERLAATFTATGGDVPALLRVLVRSPELWSAAAREQKVKSPFELAASALRALAADVTSPAAVVDWVTRMGQPLYAQPAPTGWPDRAEAWVNTGSLLARMNFGLELATSRLAGVRFDLDKLAGGAPAESPETALATLAARLLPERDASVELERLAVLVREEDLEARLAAQSGAAAVSTMAMSGAAVGEERRRRWEQPFPEYRRDRVPGPGDSSLQARVVGVLLGSPEFQRR
jgi:uncharacterized protein (DUF1800 family)